MNRWRVFIVTLECGHIRWLYCDHDESEIYPLSQEDQHYPGSKARTLEDVRGEAKKQAMEDLETDPRSAKCHEPRRKGKATFCCFGLRKLGGWHTLTCSCCCSCGCFLFRLSFVRCITSQSFQMDAEQVARKPVFIVLSQLRGKTVKLLARRVSRDHLQSSQRRNKYCFQCGCLSKGAQILPFLVHTSLEMGRRRLADEPLVQAKVSSDLLEQENVEVKKPYHHVREAFSFITLVVGIE